MKNKIISMIIVFVLFLILNIGGVQAKNAYNDEPQAALGSAFTYQGQLKDSAGKPINSNCDFQFSLYDAASSGAQIGSIQQKNAISVENGIFTVALDFGSSAFMGEARWLEVAVRCPAGSGEYSTLSPRQALTAIPYALDADLLDGKQAAAFANAVHQHAGEDISSGTVVDTRIAGSLARDSEVFPLVLASDGSGSILDADLLDGQHATAFSLAWHTHWGESWGNPDIGASFPGTFVAIYGHSDQFGGVMGQSTEDVGVYGESTNASGVVGMSTNGSGGVFQGSETGSAADVYLSGDLGRIVAYDSSNPRMSLRSDGNIVANIDSDDSGTNSFYVSHGSGSYMLCDVNEDGDLSCIGTKSAVVDTEQYGQRKLYAMESPEVWLEDLGTATLENGETTLAFDPIFAQTVSLEEDYHIFLTPLSAEPVLLYITTKSSTSFTVRGVTLDGKPSVCSFDYRVVAKRLGYEGVRLEQVNIPATVDVSRQPDSTPQLVTSPELPQEPQTQIPQPQEGAQP